MREVWSGRTYPLGATFDGYGTNFAVFSGVAERVELCLLGEREERIDLARGEGHVWNAYLPRVGPGTRYGLRVHGAWDPQQGLRCNPDNLLLDPYARSFTGTETLQGVVADPWFDWAGDRPLRLSWHDTVIYEVHVKGFTARHPEVPEPMRGTYLGMTHPAVIGHLTRLGVTAVELLPVHQFVHDGGRRNYWGYNTIGFFAPHAAYGTIADFKHMVRTLHRAGIEVILDVVYNHTAEGNHLGPTLSFRGLDNREYYRLVPDDLEHYYDYTGTGNSMHMRQPYVLQLIMDSLRYWVEEMHVDGFRFDLAATLARELQDVDRLATFLQLVHQDPVLRGVKLIAEPWDLGPGGYAVGEFPPIWSEWNGKYRDGVRDFWRGAPVAGELAQRLTGSADLYQRDGSRRPYASINFVTVHDGFTLRDLVSYEHKHNEANGEDNRDGTDDNRSWNCGVEGETDDPAVNALRARQQRNLLATLFLSQGTPMLCGGDELGRTQGGNNNAYCQDNEISWFDWAHVDAGLLEFTRRLIELYRAHPVFRRRGWFQSPREVRWFTADGRDMKQEDWGGRSVCVFLAGDVVTARDPYGRPIHDDSFYLAFNGGDDELALAIPERLGDAWQRVFDTERGFEAAGAAPGPLCPRCVAVYRRPR
jgi:isoamylase